MTDYDTCFLISSFWRNVMQPKWRSLLKVQVDPLYAMVEIWLSDDNHQHTVWTAPYCMVSFIMSIRGLKWKLELKNISLMHLNVLLRDGQYHKIVRNHLIIIFYGIHGFKNHVQMSINSSESHLAWKLLSKCAEYLILALKGHKNRLLICSLLTMSCILSLNYANECQSTD